MKEAEQKKARELRAQGKSVREIAEILDVSRGSVSRWVRGVVLTKEQRDELESRNPVVACSVESRLKQAASVSKTWRERRLRMQEAGREMARHADSGFVIGCMLYWAEGTKSKNSISFVNSDIDMMKTFVLFLREYFDVKTEDFAISLHWYSGNGVTLDDAVQYWLDNLGLERSCLRKSQVDVKRTDGYGRKKGKLPYGVCHLRVHRTDIVQKIFGAIQEMIGFQRKEWLK